MTAPIASGWSEIAGWASHPLESAAFSRRTPIAAVHLNYFHKYFPRAEIDDFQL